MSSKRGSSIKRKNKGYRIPSEMADKIKWLAKQRGMSETNIVIFALESYLDSAIKRYGESKEIIEKLKK